MKVRKACGWLIVALLTAGVMAPFGWMAWMSGGLIAVFGFIGMILACFAVGWAVDAITD